jgi:hypothetical protein
MRKRVWLSKTDLSSFCDTSCCVIGHSLEREHRYVVRIVP